MGIYMCIYIYTFREREIAHIAKQMLEPNTCVCVMCVYTYVCICIYLYIYICIYAYAIS